MIQFPQSLCPSHVDQKFQMENVSHLDLEETEGRVDFLDIVKETESGFSRGCVVDMRHRCPSQSNRALVSTLLE
jgi:hypothetical protein